MSLTVEEFKKLQDEQLETGSIIMIKFGASWCRPCKKIKPVCCELIPQLRGDVLFTEIDIDESLDLYMLFKKKKMLKGVPTILVWTQNNNRDPEHWFIPDDSVSGSKESDYRLFFSKYLN